MDLVILPSVEKFINNLDKGLTAETVSLLRLLRTEGNTIKMPYSKPLGSGLFELRGRSKSVIRYFYIFKYGQAVIVHGYIKKSQKTPLRELKLAHRRISSLT